MPDTPSKEAMEAAKKIYDNLRSCCTYEGWNGDDETETERIAAALDAFVSAERRLDWLADATAEIDALRARNEKLEAALREIAALARGRDALAADAKRNDATGPMEG